MAAELFWSKIFRAFLVSTELNLLPMISAPLTENLEMHTIVRPPPPFPPPSSKQKISKN